MDLNKKKFVDFLKKTHQKEKYLISSRHGKIVIIVEFFKSNGIKVYVYYSGNGNYKFGIEINNKFIEAN